MANEDKATRYQRLQRRASIAAAVAAAAALVVLLLTGGAVSLRRMVAAAVGGGFVLTTAGYAVAITFMLSYLKSEHLADNTLTLVAICVASAIGIFATYNWGKATDRVGRRPIYLFGTLFMVLFAFPMFLLVNTGATPVASSVGMAIASNWMAAYFNRPGFEMFNYDVYALCGDGEMMEGVSGEAASLAGHLRLSNLCWIYDDNHITIEGHTELAFSEDVGRRFGGLGWNVLKVSDANDLNAINGACEEFLNTQDRPTLIILRSVIGYGAPSKANTHEAHGAPLGANEIRGTKAFYGWPEDEQFLVPQEVLDDFRSGVRFMPGRKGGHHHAGVYGDHLRVRSRVSRTISSVRGGSFSSGTATEPPRRRTSDMGVAAGSISIRPSRSRMSTRRPR